MQTWRLTFALGIATALIAGLPSAARAQSPSPTPTVTITPTITPTPSPSGSPTPTPSITPSPSTTPSPSITPTPSTTPSPSITPTPSVTPTINPSATPTPTPSGETLLNISTRARAETGDNVLIGGFILGNGSTLKPVVVRALGPSLGARGVVSPLLDPSLQLFNSSGQIIASNNDWMTDPNAQQVLDSGLAPTDPREAAVFTTLAAGAYTVVVPGIDGTQNIALVEVYDVDSINLPLLLNISTRGFVDTGEGMMIAGVIVGGTVPKTLVVRGLGPSLAGAVGNPLPNPTVTIFDSFGFAIGSNDDWQNDPNASTIATLNLAPTNTLEAATLVTVAPGSYTAILSDATGNTGIGLVEIYNVTQ